MNARELHNWLKDDPQGAETYYQLPSHEARSTILRALRLLAAAEANDGTTPETDAAFPLSVWPADFACDFARRLERERNGLAARVAELEKDAERYRFMCDAENFCTFTYNSDGRVYLDEGKAQLDAAIDAARGAKP